MRSNTGQFTRVRTGISVDEMRSRLAAVDVAVIDIDECLLPGFTQIILGKLLLQDLLGRLRSDPRLAWKAVRMATLGMALHVIKLLPIASERKNEILQRNYIRALRHTSRAAVATAVPRVWQRLYPGAEACLRFIAEKANLGVISLGLDAVVEELAPYLATTDAPFALNFIRANRLIWDNSTLSGLVEPLQVGPAGKEVMFLEECRERGFNVPLVIGHNHDESNLCRIAWQRGGLAIGIGAEEGSGLPFQIFLARGDWFGLLGFLQHHWPPRTYAKAIR